MRDGSRRSRCQVWWLLAGLAVLLLADAAWAGKQMIVRGRAVRRPQRPVGDLSSSVRLPTNGDLVRRLETVRKSIQSKEFAAAAIVLSKLAADANTSDFFLEPSDQATGRSFRNEIQQMIAALPPEGHEAFELQCGTDAKNLLAEAAAEGTTAGLQDVVRRYLNTVAGREAVVLLADDYRERGRTGEALRLLERFVTLSPDADADPTITARRALCAQRLGESEQAVELLQTWRKAHPDGSLAIAGSRQLPSGPDAKAFAAWLEEIAGAAATTEHSTADGWLVHRGGPDRNATVPAEAPLLAPRWYREAAEEPDLLASLLRQAERLLMQKVPPLAAWQPLAVGDTLFVRTPVGMQALDLATGRVLWEYRDQHGSVGEEIAFKEAWHGTMASDGRRLFLLEDLGLGSTPSVGPNGEVEPGTQTNLLTALSINDGRQGNLCWQVGGSEGGDEPRLSGAYFLGAPLPLGDRVYAIVERQGSINLAVLDAETGHLDWTQELGLVEQTIGYDPLRRRSGATPTLAEDILICPTSRGGVVAVDLSLRTLLWAYLYPVTRQIQPHMQQHEEVTTNWVDATVMVGDGVILLAPPENNELHGVDLLTGEARWRQPRGQSCFVACVDQGRAFLVGDHTITSIDLATGKSGKPLNLPDGTLPVGYGIHAPGRYFLPLTGQQLIEIDLRKSSIVGSFRSPRQLSLGNLIWHDGAFIAQGVEFTQVFDERARLETSVAQSLKKDPHDPSALLRRAELMAAEERWDESLDSLRQAHQAAQTTKTRDRLAAALDETIERQPERKTELSAELTQLFSAR